MIDKIGVETARRIDYLRSVSPMMAVMANSTDDYLYVRESDALWSELESYL